MKLTFVRVKKKKHVSLQNIDILHSCTAVGRTYIYMIKLYFFVIRSSLSRRHTYNIVYCVYFTGAPVQHYVESIKLKKVFRVYLFFLSSLSLPPPPPPLPLKGPLFSSYHSARAFLHFLIISLSLFVLHHCVIRVTTTRGETTDGSSENSFPETPSISYYT